MTLSRETPRRRVLGDRDRDALVARLTRLYGAHHDIDALVARLLAVVDGAQEARAPELRALDERRLADPAWFAGQEMVGYVCYADRFAGTLDGVRERLDYLAELGVRYLHLMPLLKPRRPPNDGGYAVADYRSVDPRLGTMDDLEALATALRARGTSLCVDLVINHTAPEHPWAQAALAGDERYRRFYLLFPDRTLPDRYETTLRHVFPGGAPGNFTWTPELEAWVWTTFHDYQWDLDYRNPDVFVAMLETMLYLANRGVECLRLDAVPFIWKELGTSCENRPEVHVLLQAFRQLVSVAAPATIFKAEAIVAPWELTKYLGAGGEATVDECQIAYNNQLMVLLWSALAERQTELTTASLARLRPSPPRTAWATYVRGHDDIGWAITDDNASAVGLDAYHHRAFLNDFYSGSFPGSFARGALFQHDPASGDARISGSAASLAGVERALESGDEDELARAVSRLLLLYAVAFSYGGMPVVYMGDELALRNDRDYARDPARANDNRWLHRPAMDWSAASRRTDDGTLEARVFAGFRRLAHVRGGLTMLRADAPSTPLPVPAPGVLAYTRLDGQGRVLLGLANFAGEERLVPGDLAASVGLARPTDALRLGAPVEVGDTGIAVPGLTAAWLVEAET